MHRWSHTFVTAWECVCVDMLGSLHSSLTKTERHTDNFVEPRVWGLLICWVDKDPGSHLSGLNPRLSGGRWTL